MRKKGVWWQWAQWGSAPLKLWPYNRPWSIIYITDSQYSIINIFWLELVRHNEWRHWGLKHVCQFWFWLWKKENMKKTSINCFQPVIGWSVHQSNSPALLFVSSTAWCSLRMRSFLCLGRLNWAGHMLVFPLREARPAVMWRRKNQAHPSAESSTAAQWARVDQLLSLHWTLLIDQCVVIDLQFVVVYDVRLKTTAEQFTAGRESETGSTCTHRWVS